MVIEKNIPIPPMIKPKGRGKRQRTIKDMEISDSIVIRGWKEKEAIRMAGVRMQFMMVTREIEPDTYRIWRIE